MGNLVGIYRQAALRSMAAAALFFSLAAVCNAQSDAPVARPDVKAGDRWTYNLMDYWTNKVTATREWVVAIANDKIIQTVATEPGKPEIDETFTPEWNGVATTIGTYYPDTGMLRFPLRVGAKYPAEFEILFGAQRNWRAKHVRTVEVVGWEDITVPAGKFRALKVVAGGSFQRLDTSIAGSVTWTFWYVPEVKRWVKIMIEDNILTPAFQRGPFNKFGAELVSFKVQ